MTDLLEQQPPPAANTSRPIWELVVEDMHARDQFGREHYGTPLQAHNGRDPLVDAYQEALDHAVYLRQAIEERSGEASCTQHGIETRRCGCGAGSTVTVPVIPHRIAMYAEIARLKTRENELMERCSELLEKLRSHDRRQTVREFHAKFNHPLPERPVTTPDEALVRFRAKLVAEEFVEFMYACFGEDRTEPWRFDRCVEAINRIVQLHPVKLNYVEAIDACIDLPYVCEGTITAFGVDSNPLWAEVQRANMDKEWAEGKPRKPEGWRAPDILGELRRQGWLGAA